MTAEGTLLAVTQTGATRMARLKQLGAAIAGAAAVNAVIVGALMLLNAPPSFESQQPPELRVAMHEEPLSEPEPEPEQPEEPEPLEPEMVDEPLDRPTPQMETAAPVAAPLDLPTIDVAPPQIAIRNTRSSVTDGDPSVTPTDAEPTAVSGPVDADAADEPGRAVRQVQPEYPRVALRRGVTGFVTARVLVDEEGGVEQVEIDQVEGHTAFASAVQRSLLNDWRYSPTYHRGHRVAAWHAVTIRFELDG